MSELSCYCYDDYEWHYEEPKDYSVFYGDKENCFSCHSVIKKGDICLKFYCYEIDEYGEEDPRENVYMCEECGDFFYNLTELGFCITLGDDMRELVEQYAEMNKK